MFGDLHAVAVVITVVLSALVGINMILYHRKRQAVMALMLSETEGNFGTIFRQGEILTEKTHGQFLKLIASVYGLTMLMVFWESQAFPDNRPASLYIAGAFGIIGLIVLGLSLLEMAPLRKEWILTVVMGISIALIFLGFRNDPLINIIWVTPFIFLIMTIVFNREMMLLILAFVTLICGGMILFPFGEEFVSVGTRDYVARLVVYGVTVILAAFINKLYVIRLTENDQQVGFQKMIAEMTTDFIAVSEDNFDVKTDALLQKSGELIGADRAFLALLSEDRAVFHVYHEWTKQVDDQAGKGAVIPLKAIPFCAEKLFNNELVFLESVEKLPPEAESERRQLNQLAITSLIRIPIQENNQVLGFVGFDHLGAGKKWKIREIEWLRLVANMFADARKKVAVEREINGLAYYDGLTRLPNRNLLRDRMEQAIELARRTKMHLGILFIDLDGFKEVNDTLGHEWGDQLLVEMGNRFINSLRKYDTVARFGGDEFLIMIPQLTGKNDLEQIVPKVMAVFNQPLMMGEQVVNINGSCGIAIYPEDGEDVNTLIKNADLAMYAAKKSGKGQVAFCSDAMKEKVQQKMSLTNSLYRALERDELHLHYQPQVNANTQEIIGFEALIRWNHPTQGAISPAVFIPIAEETGLINSIGEWVLMTACAQNKAWQDSGVKPVQMSVNLSVEQFRCANLVPIVKKCLAETGLSPQYLELEITESIAMKETGYVANCLQELKAIGVGISIDDFGTEFSSLNRIKDLPVDRLKIDMQFVRGIAVDPKDESIIAVMIHLAKRLGLRVIAEGVETTTQLNFLKDEDCDEIQGYYYYKPLSTAEIEKDDFALLKSGLLPE